jgi:hypothetical protein
VIEFAAMNRKSRYDVTWPACGARFRVGRFGFEGLGFRCPSCGELLEFFRSRRVGVKDWFLRHVLFQNPYRCAAGDGRFFRSSHGGHHHKEQVHQEV